MLREYTDDLISVSVEYLTKINSIDSLMQMLILGEITDQKLVTLNKCICDINNKVVDTLLEYGIVTVDELNKL